MGVYDGVPVLPSLAAFMDTFGKFSDVGIDLCNLIANLTDKDNSCEITLPVSIRTVSVPKAVIHFRMTFYTRGDVVFRFIFAEVVGSKTSSSCINIRFTLIPKDITFVVPRNGDAHSKKKKGEDIK